MGTMVDSWIASLKNASNEWQFNLLSLNKHHSPNKHFGQKGQAFDYTTTRVIYYSLLYSRSYIVY